MDNVSSTIGRQRRNANRINGKTSSHSEEANIQNPNQQHFVKWYFTNDKIIMTNDKTISAPNNEANEGICAYSSRSLSLPFVCMSTAYVCCPIHMNNIACVDNHSYTIYLLIFCRHWEREDRSTVCWMGRRDIEESRKMQSGLNWPSYRTRSLLSNSICQYCVISFLPMLWD